MNNRQLVHLGLGFVLLFAAVCLFLLRRGPPPMSEETVVDAGGAEERVQLDVASAPGVEPPGLPVIDAGTLTLIAAGSTAAPPVPQLTAVEGQARLTNEQVEPAVVAVGRIVDQCFADITRRYPGEQVVTLSFEVRADGGEAALSSPLMESASLQDPFFEACVTDAPLDVTVELRAVGASRVRMPYRYPAARE